jgi:hypothetical protein
MVAGLDPATFLRHYDTDTRAVTFLGDEYRLDPIMRGIVALRDRAAAFLMERGMPPTA